MKIIYLQTYAPPDKNHLLFNLAEPEPNKLTVKLSSFVAFGEKVDMDDEWHYDVPMDPHVRMRITGSLVVDRETGKFQVFVDECFADGVDQTFRFEGSQYKLFSHLYMFNVLPGQKNLDDTDITVWLIVPPPKEEKDDAAGSPSKGPKAAPRKARPTS